MLYSESIFFYFDKMIFQNTLEVDLASFRKNVRLAQSVIGKKNFFCPIVKSSAYGLGVLKIVKVLLEEKVSALGVLTLKEALELSDLNHPHLKIFILGPLTSSEISKIAQNPRLILVVHHWNDLRLLAGGVKSQAPEVHIKMNIGMSRFGFNEEDIPRLISFFKKNKNIKLTGICSHLPGGMGLMESDDPTQNQIQSFKKTAHTFLSEFSDIQAHLYNSVSLTARMAYDLPLDCGVRLGGFLYGVKPKIFCKNSAVYEKWRNIPCHPVSTLKSYVSGVRKIEKGEGVSYDWSWKAPKPSQIAIVGMGYADGFWRSLSNRVHVLFRGRKAPVIGFVCMNFFMIDVTEFKDPRIGEEIIIYGGPNGASIDEWAEVCGTVPYEVMTGMGFTAKRVYKE